MKSVWHLSITSLPSLCWGLLGNLVKNELLQYLFKNISKNTMMITRSRCIKILSMAIEKLWNKGSIFFFTVFATCKSGRQLLKCSTKFHCVLFGRIAFIVSENVMIAFIKFFKKLWSTRFFFSEYFLPGTR